MKEPLQPIDEQKEVFRDTMQKGGMHIGHTDGDGQKLGLISISTKKVKRVSVRQSKGILQVVITKK